ncbi:hypothetical protein [Larkinella sp. C7]|jgi:hypothetical protein|uniref:hypothetical protein n=1 Tax=Larkinella sp. C7 TaxID=2576607 RepID=UPI0011114F3D|nr:hypothetical protein [Larkinella sp. C7]
MQKNFLRTVLLVIVIATAVKAQVLDNTLPTQSDTVRIEKKSGGDRFFRNSKELKIQQLQKLLKNNEQANKYLKSAKSSSTIATLFGYAGGFMMGWPLGTLMGGGKPNWALLGVGAGLASVSLPFSQSAKKKTRKAVSEYNTTLTSTSSTRFKEFNFVMTTNKVGLVSKF